MAKSAQVRAAHAAAERQAHAAVRRPWWTSRWLLLGTFAGVVAVIAILLGVGLNASKPPSAAATFAPRSVVDPVTHPDIAALESAGVTGATNPFVAVPANTPALTAGGHPLIAFVSADYCPFCAARRWSLVVALSRFGTFSHLGLTSSSSSDVYPNTSSFSFHGSTYTSSYISLSAVETETSDRAALDTPDAQVAGVLAQYDAPPYTDKTGAIPFLDIGGRYISVGGGYSPSLLQGMSAQQIAGVIRDPHSAVGQAIMADANVITAAVCSVTGDAPASVCTAGQMPQIIAALHAQ